MVKKFLILGMSNGGVFLARQLKKKWPNALLFAVGNLEDVGRLSNTVTRFFSATNAEEVDKILRCIYESNKNDGSRPIQAYFASNPMLEYAVYNYPVWFDLFEFENSFEVYSQLVKKDKVKTLCNEIGINLPKEYDLLSEDYNTFIYPVIVKPLEKMTTKGAIKCAFFENRESLVKYVQSLQDKEIPLEKICCQKAIKGNNQWEYGYGGYYMNGRPIIEIFFYQLRQSPQGLCCYTMEIVDTHLKDSLRSFVAPITEKLKYNGFIEFDIKQDSESEDLFLLDANPRPWRSSDMIVPKLGDSSVFSPSLTNRLVIWRYPVRGWCSYKNKNNVSYAQCRKIAGGKKYVIQKALVDKKDKRPYRVQFGREVKKILVHGASKFIRIFDRGIHNKKYK